MWSLSPLGLRGHVSDRLVALYTTFVLEASNFPFELLMNVPGTFDKISTKSCELRARSDRAAVGALVRRGNFYLYFSEFWGHNLLNYILPELNVCFLS